MIEKAKSNGYSWWWASHIRTKQSKWLEQNLQDMEEKVEHVLNLIQNDGDSFARRAEMYYRHRPDVIIFVEETVRAYRALAERYDKLSTELQKANTTIAAVCPEKVTYDDYDDDYTDGFSKSPKSTSPNTTPKTPKNSKMPRKNVKGLLNNASKSIQGTKKNKTNCSDDVLRSGMTKDEALEKINQLQKEIVGMQTMKEIMKGSYESTVAQFWDTESKITEHQQKLSGLQDELQVGKTIEEDGARILMAGGALKSCEETLDKLQKEQEKSILEVQQTITSLKNNEEKESNPNVSNQDDQNEINKSFESLSKNPQTDEEMADTIEKLVNKVISLESSQTALITMLRAEADDLQKKLRKAEDNKAALMVGIPTLIKIRKSLEEKSNGVQDPEQNVDNQNESLKTLFTDALHDLELLSEKIESVKLKGEPEEAVDESANPNILSPQVEEQHVVEAKDGDLESKDDDKNSQEMLLSGFEEKEKILLEEYITILRNYKDTKKKLAEEEEKNQGTVSPVRSQVIKLNSEIVKRDNEMQLLKQKLKLLQATLGEDKVDVPSEEKEEVTTSVDEPQPVSAIQEKLRTDLDAILAENVDFWHRFGAVFHQIQRFKRRVQELQEEAELVKSKGLMGKSSTSMFTTDLISNIRPIYKHLKEINNELTSWLQRGILLKDELQMRCSSLSNIQEELTRALRESLKEEEIKFGSLMAAKFQGEISNIKQENDKVKEELQASIGYATALKLEIQKTISKLEQEYGLANIQNQPRQKSSRQSRMPLRSFLCGSKSKKPKLSLFACLGHHKKSSAYKGGRV